MKKYLSILAIILTVQSCKILNEQLSCSEFYVKNELSSSVQLNNYKFIDSGFYFTIDSFVIAPGETKLINQDCRYIDSIIPYPKGAYTKFIFSNHKVKSDTFSNSGIIYQHDSINIYNRKLWWIEGDNKLRKATYYINENDSLEAR